MKKRYWNGIKLLLNPVKHLQPELSNIVRKLSKFMDEANMTHSKALICKIKCTIDTKNSTRSNQR